MFNEFYINIANDCFVKAVQMQRIGALRTLVTFLVRATIITLQQLAAVRAQSLKITISQVIITTNHYPNTCKASTLRSTSRL